MTNRNFRVKCPQLDDKDVNALFRTLFWGNVNRQETFRGPAETGLLGAPHTQLILAEWLSR